MTDDKPTSQQPEPKGKNQWLKKLLRFGVPLIITVGLCWLLFAKQDFGSMIETIRERCRWEWIWLMLGLSVVSHVIRAMRWRIQLTAIGVKIGLYPVVLSIFGTYAVNLVFPRLGELWRTTYISQRQGAPFDSVFGSMVGDRLADTVTVALLGLITFLLAGPQLTQYLAQNHEMFKAMQALLTSPWTWAALVLGLLLIWALLNRMRHNRFVSAVINFCRGIWHGLSVMLTMKGRGRFIGLTLALWGCYFLQLYVGFFAFPETAELVRRCGVIAVLVCFVFSSLSMGVPSNGGIGPWQWAVIFGLGIYGLDAARAGAFANLVLGCNTLLLIVLGLFTFICIAVDRHSMSSSSKKKINQTQTDKCQK